MNQVSTTLCIETDKPRRRKPKRAENESPALIKRLGRKNMTVSTLRESPLSLCRC